MSEGSRINQMADAWVESLDTLLNAYQDIGERLPSFMQYQSLFESNSEMLEALDLYFCDVLEFHYNALRMLDRPDQPPACAYASLILANHHEVGQGSSNPLGRRLTPSSNASWRACAGIKS